MNTLAKFATVSTLALIVAAPVSAQSTLTGVTGLNDQIDDITTEVERDQRRGQDEPPRFYRRVLCSTSGYFIECV